MERNPQDGLHHESKVVSGLESQHNLTATQLAVGIASRLDALQAKYTALRDQTTATKTYQNHLKGLLHTMQKQMLYLLLNQGILPVLSGETCYSVWHMATHNFIDCNDEFLCSTKYSKEGLIQDFRFPNLFPRFFQPFAYDFFNEMKHNITQGKDSKVSQMIFVLTADGEEIPVHMTCNARYDQPNSPTTFAMYFRLVT